MGRWLKSLSLPHQLTLEYFTVASVEISVLTDFQIIRFLRSNMLVNGLRRQFNTIVHEFLPCEPCVLLEDVSITSDSSNNIGQNSVPRLITVARVNGEGTTLNSTDSRKWNFLNTPRVLIS